MGLLPLGATHLLDSACLLYHCIFFVFKEAGAEAFPWLPSLLTAQCRPEKTRAEKSILPPPFSTRKSTRQDIGDGNGGGVDDDHIKMIMVIVIMIMALTMTEIMEVVVMMTMTIDDDHIDHKRNHDNDHAMDHNDVMFMVVALVR